MSQTETGKASGGWDCRAADGLGKPTDRAGFDLNPRSMAMQDPSQSCPLYTARVELMGSAP